MASRRWTYRALLLLALCARAAGNDIKIGDGLYSGGSLDFKINQSEFAVPLTVVFAVGGAARLATTPHALRKRGPDRRGADDEHVVAQEARVAR